MFSGGVFGHPDGPELLFWVQAEQQSLPLLGRSYDVCSVSAVSVGGCSFRACPDDVIEVSAGLAGFAEWGVCIGVNSVV